MDLLPIAIPWLVRRNSVVILVDVWRKRGLWQCSDRRALSIRHVFRSKPSSKKPWILTTRKWHVLDVRLWHEYALKLQASRPRLSQIKMASSAPKALVRSMRIVALPLVRPTASARPPNTGLTYYHFQINDISGKGEGSESGIVKWATTKATGLWAGFGQGKEGSWQVGFWFY